MATNFNFIPIKNSTWEDLSNWLEQTSPRTLVFMSKVMNYVKILSKNSLPHASLKEGSVVFTWNHELRTFVMKISKSHFHPENAQISWEIYGENKDLIHEGTASEVSWLPEELVHDFEHHLNIVKTSQDMMFLMFFIIFAMFTIGFIVFQF